VDSLFLFLGTREDLSGLEVEVSLGDRVFRVVSPASVFIPAGLMHSYKFVAGSGLFINHVLAGQYASSLLDLPGVRALTAAATTSEP
jgi:2-isopropylmalate synthase